MDDAPTRVLLIDDDPDDAVMTRDLLADVGEGRRFRMEWARTYSEGLDRVLSGEHDVCLLDYRLGERDGLQLLREALARGCRAPVILVTGQGDDEVDIEAMRAGAADYLVKGEISAPILERSIRYAIERQRMDRLKDALIAFVSHELRVPITAVKGFALTLQQGELELDELGVECVDAILNASDHLLRMIDSFLDLSRVQAGYGIELVPAELDPAELVEQAVAVQRAAAVHCTLSTECGVGLVPILADRDRLLQVLLNLLSNADKYSPGGGEVRVSVTAEPAGLRFAVADHGLGIPLEAQADVFTPFYRVPSEGRHHVRGTGVGLFLCRQIVEAHGGTIGVESESGHGSTFFFTIPL
jgi:signal transduction histidine kinase